jgi:NAD(P)H-hydrate epimerase
MTVPLPHDDAGRIVPVAMSVLAQHLEKATAIGLGPGLGQSDALTELVGQLYQTVKQPMVVDADALNALSKQPAILPHAAGPRILTPHPGEFARLTGRDKIPLDQRETLARDFAHRNGIVLVLKGHRTVITDGTQLALNATGNPGMATGGTGDVLTGLITSLLCQQLAPYDAARLGCHVHGLAGDLAADELGQISLIASDLVKYLPMAWQLTQTGEA